MPSEWCSNYRVEWSLHEEKWREVENKLPVRRSCSEALLNNLGITVNNTALYTYKLLKGRFSMSSGQKRNAIM